MKRIIFATENAHKLVEIREILSDAALEIVSMKEAGLQLSIEENGTTFAENALIKARAVWEATGVAAMADDSGLEVDYMNKEPGIYSARYLGRDTSYLEKNQYIIDRLKDAKGEERSARFVCAIAYVEESGAEHVVVETIEGTIATEIAGENGFGYDPIFYVPEYGKTTAELTPEEKNAISHRGKGLRRMRALLQESGVLA